MKIGAVVLCGGKSSRMGHTKAFLLFNNETFLDRTLRQLQSFEEILLSLGRPTIQVPAHCHVIIDQYADCGPMAGLHAALKACQSDALLAVSCDMPYFCADLINLLLRELSSEIDAVIPVSQDGRQHPLCAIYRKETYCIFERFLSCGDYKLRSALRQMKVRFVPVTPAFEKYLTNVNTPDEYQGLLKSPCIADL